MIFNWNPAIVKSNLKLSGLLIVAGCIATLLSCSNCWDSADLYFKVAGIICLLWLALWHGNDQLSCWLTNRISWIDFPVRRFLLGILVTITYTIAAIFIIALVYELITGFSLEDYFIRTLITSLVITLLITIFLQSRSFLMNWKEATIQSERLQREGMAARYESLKNQVNPHFLFNSLNALTNLVYQDPDKAAKFIKQLSDVYRYVLDTRNREVVSLREELKFLNSYLFLQQIRFGNNLKVDEKLTLLDSRVAPLVLQMLVENAIKHNILSEADPLIIKLYADSDFIVVENNVQKKTIISEESPGVGLENIIKRYEFLSETPVEVIETSALFTVKLPVIQPE